LEQQLKKQHAQHESVCAEMLERLTHLEEANRPSINPIHPIHPIHPNECNKCNENYNNYCNNCNPNPFDFSAIYDHYDKTHYLDGCPDECPALDLIANHYASVVESASAAAVDDDPDDDDDMFELIQIDPSFNVPSVPAAPLSK